ncbi:unnamed protein product, partial [Phaeothamnion confervicola]
VTVDRTRPTIAIGWTRAGTRAVFHGRVSDAGSGPRPNSIRWSLGDGDTARGPRVVRRFAEARARRLVVTALDAAGN